MTRTADAIDGLAIDGAARVGALGFRTPALAVPGEAVSDAIRDTVLSLAAGTPTTDGRRALTLGSIQGRLALDFRIPTAEAGTGSAEPGGDGTWVVHFPAPEDEARRLIEARPELIVLANARALFAEGEPFVRAVGWVRRAAGGRPVLWAPGVTLPHRIPLLTYLGVDVLDATAALLEDREGRTYDATLGRTELPPAAPSPEGPTPSRSIETPSARASRALGGLVDELDRSRAALRGGRLRELVEARLTAEPLLVEILRYADALLYPVLDERTPVVSSSVRSYCLRESFRRPEAVRFAERLIQRYRPPPSKRVLLIVPCSRTKPYRNSRSHRRIFGSLETLAGLPALHTVSVTSPLGVVPRELEDVYPARHYDIPVTGEWDGAERSRVVGGLRHLLRNGRYERVILHLDPLEYAFLREAGIRGSWTAEDGRVTSTASLTVLREEIREALESGRGPSIGPLAAVREGLRELAAVQFGRRAAAALFAEPVRLAGRPWFQRLTDGQGTDLATWQETRGLFQLTAAGGDRILPSGAYQVEVDARLALQGDLFAPGVVRADPSIRVGDAVCLVQDGRLLGVGEAELPGPLMASFARGRAVTVRHRARPVAPVAPPTAS
jgi:archaeosine synthase